MKFNKKLSARALLLLMALEGFRAVPYLDIAGVWTDGYGNTHGVVPGQRVTREQARETLEQHVAVFGKGVQSCLDYAPTQGQFDAFVLMAVNTGLGAKGKASGFCWLKDGRNSTVVRRYNAGDEGGACLAMLQWVKAAGRYSQGLFNRRWQEYQLCVSSTQRWRWSAPRHITR